MRAKALLAAATVAALASCGVPTDPNKGPVVLLCEGEQDNYAANGQHEREHMRVFYRIDGREHTFQKWDDTTQSFGIPSKGLIVTPTEVRYTRNNPVLAGIMSMNTTKFDRVTGRVSDDFVMSNGGVIGFTGSCKPVKSATSDTKF